MTLLELSSCHITQNIKDNIKSDWRILSDKGELLGTLPTKLKDKEAMSIIHFIREIELKAFNIGIDFGKKQGIQTQKELRERNNILSDELNKLTGA